MANINNLPRFVRVDYATYSAGTPAADTLYFISDLGVIYQGSNLVTKGVQTDNTKKVPGLFYVLGSGKDAQIVTYASAEAEATVIAISENAIDNKISTAIGELTAADLPLSTDYVDVTGGATITAGMTLEAAVQALDTVVAGITGDGDDSLPELAERVGTLEGDVTGINEKIGGSFSAENTVAAAIEDVDGKFANYTTTEDMNAILGGGFSAASTVKAAIDSKVNTADLPDFGDVVTYDAADFDAAGSAAAVDAKLGGNFGTGEGQQTVAAAISAVDAKFASYSTTEQVDSKINTALASVLKFKGIVADKAALDAITGMVEGDVYYVTADSKEFVYVARDGKTEWEELGASVDYTGMLAPYLLIGDTFTNGQVLVASVDGESKSAVTTGLTVGGAAIADEPAATVLATEAAVEARAQETEADIQAIIDRMAWQDSMPTA